LLNLKGCGHEKRRAALAIVYGSGRAYERGYERYIVPGPGRFRGPGRMKVRTLRFTLTKPELMVAFSIRSAAGSFNSFPTKS